MALRAALYVVAEATTHKDSPAGAPVICAIFHRPGMLGRTRFRSAESAPSPA